MWLKPLDMMGANYSEKTIGAYNLQWFGRVGNERLMVQAKASLGENMTQ